MAIWNEPYPGFFNDNIGSSFLTQLNEAFMPDSKWIVNREEQDSSDNNPMSEFAEFNAAVLGIIHYEKRFPTKNELATIKCNQRENALVSKLAEEISWEIDKEIINGLTGTFTDDKDTGISASSCDTITIIAGGAASDDFTVNHDGTDFTVHLNGLSDVDIQPLPQSALLSTKGCNNYNTSKKFLSEIKNYE